MLGEIIGGAALGGAGVLVYAVRGKSSRILGPSVWRGPRDRPAVALTFDDGPSESTPELLGVLARHSVPATFFQCGFDVRRLPAVSRAVAEAGHEIGNHSDSHAPFYFRPPGFIFDELERAQLSIEDAAGVTPALFRAPYGARWFGVGSAQRRLGLLGVMWTVIGLDWKRTAAEITRRVLRRAGNGAIICLHDGRELQPDPDIGETIEAVRRIVPALLDRGLRFETVSGLLRPTLAPL